MAPLYAKRREFTRQIPKFWPTVFDACELLSDYLNFEDLELLDCVKDLYVERSEDNPKNFTISLEFEPNKYLEDLKVEKKFNYLESESDDEESEGKYVSDPVALKWKKGKNLTRPGPTTQGSSFFNFFSFSGSGAGDYKHGEDVALVLAEDIYPHALKFYADAGNDIEDEYDISEDDDEEDSDHEHGDEPPKKRARA